MSVPFDSVRVKNRIKEGLDKLYTEVDPAVLNRYRTLFKQEVSLFKRANFAAYLLWELDQRGGGRRYPESGGGRYRRYGEDGGNNRPGRDGGDAPRTYPLAEEESVRLFISIGRSRRVFPREILGLIISKTAVSKDDVGAIRILDNYSFVQVRNTVAELIIDTLNGKPFRGRPLSVNYARARRDADTTAFDGRDESREADDGDFNDSAGDDITLDDDNSVDDDDTLDDEDFTGDDESPYSDPDHDPQDKGNKEDV